MAKRIARVTFVDDGDESTDRAVLSGLRRNDPRYRIYERLPRPEDEPASGAFMRSRTRDQEREVDAARWQMRFDKIVKQIDEMRPFPVERHGQHIGQEGTPEGGSQPGYTHVPGSLPAPEEEAGAGPIGRLIAAVKRPQVTFEEEPDTATWDDAAAAFGGADDDAATTIFERMARDIGNVRGGGGAGARDDAESEFERLIDEHLEYMENRVVEESTAAAEEDLARINEMVEKFNRNAGGWDGLREKLDIPPQAFIHMDSEEIAARVVDKMARQYGAANKLDIEDREFQDLDDLRTTLVEIRSAMEDSPNRGDAAQDFLDASDARTREEWIDQRIGQGEETAEAGEKLVMQAGQTLVIGRDEAGEIVTALDYRIYEANDSHLWKIANLLAETGVEPGEIELTRKNGAVYVDGLASVRSRQGYGTEAMIQILKVAGSRNMAVAGQALDSAREFYRKLGGKEETATGNSYETTDMFLPPSTVRSLYEYLQGIEKQTPAMKSLLERARADFENSQKADNLFDLCGMTEDDAPEDGAYACSPTGTREREAIRRIEQDQFRNRELKRLRGETPEGQGPVEQSGQEVQRGGEGSGHFGHEGRPGEVGGSEPGYQHAEERPATPGEGTKPKQASETIKKYKKLSIEEDPEEETFKDLMGAMEDWPERAQWIAHFIVREFEQAGGDEVDEARDKLYQENVGLMEGDIMGTVDQYERDILESAGTIRDLRERFGVEKEDWKNWTDEQIKDRLIYEAASEALAAGDINIDMDDIRADDTNQRETIQEAIHEYAADQTYMPTSQEAAEWIGAEKGVEEGEHFVFGRDDDGDIVAAALLKEANSDDEEWGEFVGPKLRADLSANEEITETGALYLHYLATDMGKGHGAAIMEAIFRQAARQDRAIVFASLHESKGFYEKLGAHFTGEETEGEGLDAYWTASEIREIVDNLQTPEPTGRTFVWRHGIHVDQKGTPEGGSEPGYTHVPGSVRGEGRKKAGLTSHRPGRNPREVFQEMRDFEKKLRSLSGVKDVTVSPGVGAWQGGREPTWIIDYAGNGNALELIRRTAAEYNQDAAILLGDPQGTEGSVTEITFGESIEPEERGEIENILIEAGQTGWTWSRETGGRAKMTLMSLPQYEPDAAAHTARMERVLAQIQATGMRTSRADYRTPVRVFERGRGYE